MRENLLKIVRNYLSGKASAPEKEFLEAYYAWFETDSNHLEQYSPDEIDAIRAELKAGIDQGITVRTGKRIPLWVGWSAAASVLIIVSLGILFLKDKEHNREQILPVNNGIVLTLANGKQISIDKTDSGTIKLPDGSLVKNSGDALDYSNVGNEHADLQTLTNNTGKTYQLKLSDGTAVYLDVNSSITYPAVFKGVTRNIIMTGQAYFKVVHHSKMPFVVAAANETIRDIGTEFNVDCYGSLKTTLAEGAISIRDQVLKPGQQAAVEGPGIVVRPVDVEATTAWINDKIIFDHTTLEEILHQVSRVYGTRIEWQDDDLKKLQFGGVLSRTDKLSSILNLLRKTGEVNFIVDQHIIHVVKP